MDRHIQKLNFDFLTNQHVMQLVAAIDEYRGKWNVIENRENRYLKELRKTVNPAINLFIVFEQKQKKLF
jgi:hypothetical protein